MGFQPDVVQGPAKIAFRFITATSEVIVVHVLAVLHFAENNLAFQLPSWNGVVNIVGSN